MEQVMTVQSGSRGITLIFIWPLRRMEMDSQRHSLAALPQGEKVAIVQ